MSEDQVMMLAGPIFLIVLLIFMWFRTKSPPPVRTEEAELTEHNEAYSVGPLRVIIEERKIDTQWVTDLFFADDDPVDWNTYHGQEKIKEFVQLQIDVVPPKEGLKLMFIAPKGSGKTTLFRIIAKKLLDKRGGRYLEITPAMVKTKEKLDDLMANLCPGDVLCIDEIHMLNRNNADTLLPAVEDNVFPFDAGMRALPPAITWIGATTDIGLLPEAFQDRFQILTLHTLPVDDLVKILKDLPYPITHDAAQEIAVRSIGSPRELKRVYKTSRDVATRDNHKTIDLVDAQEAFRLLELDENGLYYQDRKVLEALYKNPKLYAPRADGTRMVRYAHSERAIRALTGLDENLYRDQIEPKLLRQGFITIGTGGRELTDKTFLVYFPQALQT